MKDREYAKTLAKIRVRGIFRIRDIRRNVSPKFIEIYLEFYEVALLVAIRMGTNIADGNQQKHLLPSFSTKA